MPTYTYKCKECGGVFDKFHRLLETCSACSLCGESNIEKIPTLGFILQKPTLKEEVKKEVGKTTQEEIEKAREQLKEEKKSLRNRIIE